MRRAGIRVFADFDDTLYSSMGARHYSFTAGTDKRHGSNKTHGRIYAGLGWLFYAIAYAHGGPAKAMRELIGAAESQGLGAQASAAREELVRMLSASRTTWGRMDVVVVTARPSLKDERGVDNTDERAGCFVDEARMFGGYKHPGDTRVIEYFGEVASQVGNDEGWGFAKSHGYTYLSTFLPGMLWNVLGGITNFVTTLDVASPAHGEPSMWSDKRQTFEIVAQHKANFILSWAWQHPEESFVWFGDNGQGDVCTGGLLLKNLTADPLRRLRGIFIHDMRSQARHRDDPKWAGHRDELGIQGDAFDKFSCGVSAAEFAAEIGHRVFFFENYLEAGQQVRSAGLIDEEGEKLVTRGFYRDRGAGFCCDNYAVGDEDNSSSAP